MAKDERLLPLPIELQKLSSQEASSVYAPVYDNDSFAEKRFIREYVAVVLKRKWMIIAIATIVTISTAIYMYRLPSQYASQTEISIEPRRPKQSKDAININLGANDTNYRNTQLKLIQSPDLMRAVVINLGLHRNQNLFDDSGNPGLFSKVSRALIGTKEETNNGKSSLPVLTDEISSQATNRTYVLSPEEQKRADDYARALVGGLTVIPDASSYLVTLKYQSTNQQLAVNIPNAVAQVFIAQDIQRETEGIKQQSEDNIRTIDDLQQTINTLENERIDYLKKSDLPLTEKGQDLVAARLTTLSTQWLAAEDDLRKMRASYEAAVRAKSSGNAFSVPEISESKAVQDARSKNAERVGDLKKRIDDYDDKIADLETKRSELLSRYTEEFRDVKQVDQQIKKLQEIKAQTQNAISAEVQREDVKLIKNATDEVLGSMRARYEAAAKREAELRQAYFQERAASNTQGQAEIKLTTLTQQIETNRKLLDSALQRQKSLELEVNSSRPDNIKITNPAQGAGIVGPRRNTNTIIALLASLAAGIGLAFLLDYLDDSIKSSDDVGRHLGLPTLALVPYNEPEIAGAGKKLAKTNGSASTALVSLDDTRSATAEAYRHLRTSLLFSSVGKPPQAILVTSSQPSEGKTTTAINTAITLAQSDAEVVIIDCDLRRPRLHHHFQFDNAHGLTNYLSGDRNTELLLKPHPRLPNLKIVTSGPIPPNPAEMLGSNEMRAFVDYLRSNFKHVVIDSPPAISFTDATILSTFVDGVVIVAMVGKSSIHLIRRFKQRLNNTGARIYGVVLNGLKRNSLDYGYGYYGYGYNSYYYSHEDENDPSRARVEDIGK